MPTPDRGTPARLDPDVWRRQHTLAVLAGWDRLPADQLHQLVHGCPDQVLPDLLTTPGLLTHTTPAALLTALLTRGDTPAHRWAHLLTAARLPDPTSSPAAQQHRLRLAATGLPTQHPPTPQAASTPRAGSGSPPAPVPAPGPEADPANPDAPTPRWTTIPATPSVPLTGHTDWVRAVCTVTLPGGRQLLATGSWDDEDEQEDGTVRLWDPATGVQVGLLHLLDAVHAVAGLNDGSLAVGYGMQVAVFDWSGATTDVTGG